MWGFLKRFPILYIHFKMMHMIKIMLRISAIVLLFPAVCFAQEKVDMAMMQKIRDEEKNNSQVAMIAHNLTDVCGPRLTNSPGYKRSIEWITKTFNEWGLQNAGPE